MLAAECFAQGVDVTRFIAFVYGLVCYFLFLIVFLYFIAFLANVIVPRTIDDGPPAPVWRAVLTDFVLLAIFALQHSVMARQGFKRRWTRYVPAAMERSTYVLASTLALALLIWQWRPIPHPVWQVMDPLWGNLLLALALLGWLTAGFSTFLISHFEQFGMAQVTRHLLGRGESPPRLRTPLLYRLVRHPLYLGFLVAFWAAPVMTAGHLLFAILATLYICVGTVLEERDLLATFGEEYRRYQARVPSLLPLHWPF
jgi:protein-S-isoprenylcysteine O-methyltransferase Ste14